MQAFNIRDYPSWNGKKNWDNIAEEEDSTFDRIDQWEQDEEKEKKKYDPELLLTDGEIQARQEKEAGNQFYKRKKFYEALASYSKAMQLDPKQMIYVLNRSGK